MTGEVQKKLPPWDYRVSCPAAWLLASMGFKISIRVCCSSGVMSY
jgi:hypothetical protein